MMRKKSINWGQVLTYFLVTVFLIGTIFPVLWMLGMALKTPIDVMAMPPKFFFTPTTENFVRLFVGTQYSKYEVVRTDFVEGLKNSLIVSAGATTLSLITSTLTAYALARFRWPGRDGIAFRLLGARFAPGLASQLPMYAVYRRIGLYNTHIGLILMMQNISLPLLGWVTRSHIESIPAELEQAAMVDGYSWWGSFTKILFPLIAPGVAATSVLSFIACWNDFGTGMLLGGRDTHTITVQTLGMISYEQVLWGQMAAAACFSVLPGVILTLLVQRWIVRGLTFGAVKA